MSAVNIVGLLNPLVDRLPLACLNTLMRTSKAWSEAIGEDRWFVCIREAIAHIWMDQRKTLKKSNALGANDGWRVHMEKGPLCTLTVREIYYLIHADRRFVLDRQSFYVFSMRNPRFYVCHNLLPNVKKSIRNMACKEGKGWGQIWSRATVQMLALGRLEMLKEVNQLMEAHPKVVLGGSFHQPIDAPFVEELGAERGQKQIIPIAHAARHGRDSVVNWLWERSPQEHRRAACVEATLHGWQKLAVELFSRDPSMFSDIDFSKVESVDSVLPCCFIRMLATRAPQLCKRIAEQAPHLLDYYHNVNGNLAHLAAFGGSLETLSWLMTKRPGLFDAQTNKGFLPIHCAIAQYQVKCTEYILCKDPLKLFVSPGRENKSPLSYALKCNTAKIFDLVFRLMEEFKHLDADGYCSILLYVFRQMVGLEATGSAFRQSIHRYGLECFEKALRVVFERKPGLLAIVGPDKRTYLQRMFCNFCETNLSDSVELLQTIHRVSPSLINDGFSLLAILYGNKQALEFILEKDPEHLDRKNAAGLSCLQRHFFNLGGSAVDFVRRVYAVAPDRIQKDRFALLALSAGSVKDLEFVLEKDPSQLIAPGEDRQPLLNSAIRQRKKPCVDFLLRKYPDQANCMCAHGFSPLRIAVTHGDWETVKAVEVYAEAKLDARMEVGYTMAHIAAAHGRVDMLERLCTQCPEMHRSASVRGDLPIHLSASNDQLETLEYLLGLEKGLGGDPLQVLSVRNAAERSPFDSACFYGRTRIARYLMEKFPGIERGRSSSGKSALDWAEEKSHQEVIQLLEPSCLKRPLEEDSRIPYPKKTCLELTPRL